jgi:hypothetical protein
VNIQALSQSKPGAEAAQKKMQRSQKLVNDPANCVMDAVEGVLLSNSALSVIEGETVIVRSDIDAIKQQQV